MDEKWLVIVVKGFRNGFKRPRWMSGYLCVDKSGISLPWSDLWLVWEAFPLCGMLCEGCKWLLPTAEWLVTAESGIPQCGLSSDCYKRRSRDVYWPVVPATDIPSTCIGLLYDESGEPGKKRSVMASSGIPQCGVNFDGYKKLPVTSSVPWWRGVPCPGLESLVTEGEWPGVEQSDAEWRWLKGRDGEA